MPTTVAATLSTTQGQDNLRNRVAMVEVREEGWEGTQGACTRYSYDIHGNVHKLYQKLPGLPEEKTIAYDYDLISGNVHKVKYQGGLIDDGNGKLVRKSDAFYHKYQYDADNRLTHVYTSTNDYLWYKEAEYLYYAHGPLARVELGEYHVQGLDYYYNLQGWFKRSQ